MSKNAMKIAQGLKTLTHRQYEIMSGTVVAGTVDETDYSCDVLPSGMDEPIKGVMLNTVLGNANGLIQFPADNSDATIASIDGSGEYFLVRAATLYKTTVNIGESSLIIDNNGYSIEHNGESLTQILKDLLDTIVAITVPTSSGASGTPINATDFTNIKTRLNNLLT